MTKSSLLSPASVATASGDPHQDGDFPPRPLGVTWTNLTVKVDCIGATTHDNVLSQLNPASIFHRLCHQSTRRTILDNSHGCVKPGEMLLVLGRPGSGCSTLLNVLANQSQGYACVSGDVNYGCMSATESRRYRGQIVLSSEDEIFFPSLTVSHTLDFANRLKSPHQHSSDTRKPSWSRIPELFLRALDINHILDTKIGNEYIRGVSGGERRRVSIAECLSTKASVYCWDNSTRGLDASTALAYVQMIRNMTKASGLSSIMTLYQASDDIYNLFDKVLILEEGRQIFYGPSKEAQSFIESLGFQRREGANVADFFTGITVESERIICPGYELSHPRTVDAIHLRYKQSEIFSKMVAEYKYPSSTEAVEATKSFQATIQKEKSTHLPHESPFTVGFFSQLRACIIRQYQIIWGDKITFWTKQATVLVQALVAGSLFYDAPDTSLGISPRSSAIFFAIMFNTLLAMSEVTVSFSGRPVLAKHRSYALLHPAMFCIAQIATDMPIILCQITIFSLVLYFMVGLTSSAKSFAIFWIILVSTTMCMTALFRSIGAAFTTFDKASKASGLTIIATVLYTGFMIPKPDMHPWFVWIYWINPLAYAFNALVSNEFSGKNIECAGANLLPVGPGYNDSAYQSCAGIVGAIPGEPFVTGDAYLEAHSYSFSDLWRNFGVIWAWWAFFVIATIISTSWWKFSSAGPSMLRTPKEKDKGSKKPKHRYSDDEENQSSSGTVVANEHCTNSNDTSLIIHNSSVFTWKDISYTVKTTEGQRKLLDNVYGWVKPGMLGALMGASGAGKTTLLDILAQRKTEGSVQGSIMVDGRPLPISFQRSTGYCEQLDIHEPYSTVREALEFSAQLRQSRDTTHKERLQYVNEIICLLELDELADVLIGTVGNGLSVEQRKRVTIGVELVSKPSILLFLDEPTSGLDGQSAFNTVRFLRKLANLGQAILVTIHQPSAQLFSQFDTLLLLSSGKMAYFGDIGEDANIVKDYFERNGSPCASKVNPAEHIINVVSEKPLRKDWTEIWRNSPEHNAAMQRLQNIVSDAASKPPGRYDDGYEFSQPLLTQIKFVTRRMNTSLFRNTGYINNKLILHVFCGLYNGFSFWQIGDSLNDLQLRVFTIFNFIFVAPGVISQLQPLFIERRILFETRESKSKTYSWIAFVSALIVSELPYLVICAVLYFCCWYYTVGFPRVAERTVSTLFIMLMYEFLYTGIGQFIAAYAPNPVFASLVNPFVLGVLIMFCGVLVSYDQMTAFWRYWLYWLNPFSYIMGSLLIFSSWDISISCSDDELVIINPPDGMSCAEYFSPYLSFPGVAINLTNPGDMANCMVCPYKKSNDQFLGFNLKGYYYGWRDAGIVFLFVLSSYSLVFLLMKLRTKTPTTTK